MEKNYPDQDGVLLQEIREGNAASFNRLYEKYWEKVYLGALRRLGDHGRAQDITQDIFSGLWLRRAQLEIDNLDAYFYAAVRNRVLNFFERERRYIPFEELLGQISGESADMRALRREFMGAYRALIDAMPERRKKIFVQFYEEGRSTAEIAQGLALSRKTVQNQLGRAVSYLRTNLTHLAVIGILLSLS